MSRARPGLTRRGRVLALVVVVGAAMGWYYGGRSLNAVVVPGGVLVAAGLLTVGRTVRLTIRRRVPQYGFVGDTARVELEVDGNRPWSARLVDRLPDGLVGDSAFELVADGRTVSYDLDLAERGVHELGPVRIAVADEFGLWERVLVDDVSDTVVVFPNIRPLHESADLLAGYVGLTAEREQFDSIREYTPGDALRDVNWKASAKRADDLIVTEYAGEGATTTVTVGVSAPRHRADSVAEAGASVAVHLLDAGLSVGLITPSESVTPGRGDEHQRRLLTALARLDQGSLTADERDAADVRVRAPADGRHVRIEVSDASHRFSEFLTDEEASRDVDAPVTGDSGGDLPA
ncbi:MAG: DUF58 domain-containing protein [Halobacteriaceae archaeon]